MDKVYVISRFRANEYKQQEFNKAVARYFCRQIVNEGKVPVAPHIFYTQFLDDSYPEDRERGTKLGIWELRNAQEFMLVIIDGVISEGMRNEIEEVSRLELPGRIVTMTQKEITEAMKVVR